MLRECSATDSPILCTSARSRKNGYLGTMTPENADSSRGSPLKPRVLVADDDPGSSGVVRKILEKEGFEVVVAPDGGAALSAATDGSYNLAVLDVTMPVMDGFELIGHLRALPQFGQVPIMMLTASDGDADILKGFALGAADYMVKPFNRAEFVTRVWMLVRE